MNHVSANSQDSQILLLEHSMMVRVLEMREIFQDPFRVLFGFCYKYGSTGACSGDELSSFQGDWPGSPQRVFPGWYGERGASCLPVAGFSGL